MFNDTTSTNTNIIDGYNYIINNNKCYNTNTCHHTTANNNNNIFVDVRIIGNNNNVAGQNNTLTEGRRTLNDSGRATLRNQISINNNINVAHSSSSTYTDDNAATMKNELDAASRATLRNQLFADKNIDKNATLDNRHNTITRTTATGGGEIHTLRFQADSNNISPLRKELLNQDYPQIS